MNIKLYSFDIKIMFTICLCVLLWTIVPGQGDVNIHTYKMQWGSCSDDNPFLTHWNIAMDKCVLECNIRSACHAVNYWTRRYQCDMLFNNTEYPLQELNHTHACVFVKKHDFDSATQLTCPACADNEVCDIGSHTCEVKECRQLLIPNATTKGNILSVGSKIRIYCDSSFVQRPNETLSICQKNGTWSNEPTCHYLYACAEPPTIANATIDMGTRAVGDVRYYTCDTGFVDPHAENESSKSSIQCQDNGTWTCSEFQCVADCNEPLSVVNATVSPGTTIQDSGRNYMCNVGYSEINNAPMNVTCQQNGKWTTVSFECVQDCIAPPIVVNEVVLHGATMQGSERSYTCNNGYIDTNNAPMTVTCQQDGTWTTVSFECVQSCANPPTIANAVLDTGTTLVGDERHYSCKSGFSAVGTVSATFNTLVRCNSDGTWSNAKFQCVAAFACPADELDFHQGVLPDGTVFQFRAFFDALRDFDGAMAKCAEEGGSLYQILTLEKMTFTLQLMACSAYQSYNFWIDGVYNQAKSVWETTAGTPLPMSQTDFWYTGRPNDPGAETCVVLSQSMGHKWDDGSCSSSPVYAFCEII